MSDEEDQISPEEKLLKVIQDKGEEPAKEVEATRTEESSPAPESVKEPAAAEVAESTQEETVATDAGEPTAGQKPKLKMSKVEDPEAADAKTDDVGSKAEPSTSAGLIGASSPVVSVGKKRAPLKLGIGAANRCLAAVIVIALMLTGLEVWNFVKPASAATMTGNSGVESTTPTLDIPIHAAQYSFPDVLKSYRQKPIFVIFEPGSEIGTEGGGRPLPPQPRRVGWAKYARANMKLMGLSPVPDSPELTEAIIADTKTKRMYFAKVGDKLVVSGRQVSVLKINGALVILTDGVNNVTIE